MWLQDLTQLIFKSNEGVQHASSGPDLLAGTVGSDVRFEEGSGGRHREEEYGLFHPNFNHWAPGKDCVTMALKTGLNTIGLDGSFLNFLGLE